MSLEVMNLDFESLADREPLIDPYPIPVNIFPVHLCGIRRNVLHNKLGSFRLASTGLAGDQHACVTTLKTM